MRRTLSIALFAVVATGCGGAGSPRDATPTTALASSTTRATTTSTTTTSTSTSAADSLGAELVAVIAQGPAAMQDRIDAEARAVDLALADATGMTEALGGRAATQAAFDELYVDLERMGRAFAPPTGPARGRPGSSPGGFKVGGGWTAALTATFTTPIATQAALAATSDGPAKGSTSELSISGDIGHVELSWDMIKDSGSVTGGVKVKIVMNPCPDADGVVTAEIDVKSSATGGGVGGIVHATASLKGQVNDDAELVSTEIDSEMETTEFTTSGTSASHTVGTLSGTVNADGSSAGTPEVDITEAQSTGQIDARSVVAQMALVVYGTANTVMDAAKKAWQGGRCV
jgi:hypothetical protein